jgi:hypothetical protein
MLFRPELLGMSPAKPVDDGERGQLRRKPALNRGNVRVELGRQAKSSLQKRSER